MSSWVLKFTDTFTGTHYDDLPTHNAAWTVDGGSFWISSSNQLASSSSSNRTHITTSGISADQAAEVAMLNNGDYAGPCVRYTSVDGTTDNFTGYCAFYNGNTVYFYERKGTDWGANNSWSRTFTSGDVLRIEMVGTQPRVYVNGTELTPAPSTNADYATGQPGIRAPHAYDPLADTFNAYSWESASGVSIPVIMHHLKMLRKS